jgi:hypothetical protein
MSNIIRFVTKNNKSKTIKNLKIVQNCEILLFTGVRYCRSEDDSIQNSKSIKRRRSCIKQQNEPKRRRGN